MFWADEQRKNSHEVLNPSNLYIRTNSCRCHLVHSLITTSKTQVLKLTQGRQAQKSYE